MSSLFSFLGNARNQKTLAFLGAGGVAVASAVWAVVTYVWPPGEAGRAAQTIVCAGHGAIAAGRDASGNTINYTGGAPTGSGSQESSCAEAAKRP